MPIYEFQCYTDNVRVEKFRKIGDTQPPICSKCGQSMERVFSIAGAVFKGKSESRRVTHQLKKRSEQQGKKFFKRHPKYQDFVSKTLDEKVKGV